MSWDKKLRCLSFLNLGANDSSQERKIICFITQQSNETLNWKLNHRKAETTKTGTLNRRREPSSNSEFHFEDNGVGRDRVVGLNFKHLMSHLTK